MHSLFVSAVKPIIREHAKWMPVYIPLPKHPVNLKQYRILGEHQKVTDTIQVLLDVGVFRPAASPFPVRKPDGTYWMTIDYRGQNKVGPPLTAVVPDILSLYHIISQTAGEWHAVLDLVNALFSISIDKESQDQFAFTWEGKKYTANVVPQGYFHGPTICHGLLARDLAMLSKLHCKLYHYIHDIILSGNTEGQVRQDLTTVQVHMQNRR